MGCAKLLIFRFRLSWFFAFVTDSVKKNRRHTDQAPAAPHGADLQIYTDEGCRGVQQIHTPPKRMHHRQRWCRGVQQIHTPPKRMHHRQRGCRGVRFFI